MLKLAFREFILQFVSFSKGSSPNFVFNIWSEFEQISYSSMPGQLSVNPLSFIGLQFLKYICRSGWGVGIDIFL